MNDDFEPVNFDFLINSAEIKTESANVKAELNGLIKTGEEMADVVAKAFKTPVSSEATAAIGRVTSQYQQGAITLQKYREELDKINNVQSQPVKISTDPAADNLGAIPRLQSQIKALNETKLTLDAQSLPAINAQLEGLNNELNRLNKIGTEAFEKLNDEVQKPVGQIERLQVAMKLYNTAAETSFNPDIIAKYNAKLEDAAIRMEKLQRAGKTGFDNSGTAKVDQTALNTGLTGFSALAPAAQSAYTTIAKLKDEITLTRAQQQGLDAAYRDGALAVGDYDKASIGLSLREGELREKIQATNAALQNNPANIDKNKSSYDGLGNSITQITRELPAFTFSLQTGFEAISNNIGPLADELGRVGEAQKRNMAIGQADAATKGEQAKATALAGGASEEAANQIGELAKQQALATLESAKGPGVLKQLVSGIFSWNTLISVGITLLTVYGKEIAGWITELIKGKDSLDGVKESVKLLNDAIGGTEFSKAISGVQELRGEIDLAKKGFIDKTGVVDHYNSTIGNTIGQVKTLDEAEKALQKNADSYIKMMLYKASATLALDEAAKQALKSAQERNKSDDDSIGYFSSGLKNGGKASQDLYKEIAARNRETAAAESDKDQKSFEKIAKDFQIKAAQISKDSNFNYQGDSKKDDAAADKKDGTAAKKAAAEEKRQETAAAAELKRRQNLLKQIADLEADYSRKGMTNDQAELQSVKDKFDKMRLIIAQFNADPDNGTKYNAKLLKPAEDQAIQDLLGKQQVDKSKIIIDQQKVLYDNFEDYKLKYGEAKAQERFGNDVKLYGTYLDFLKAQMPAEDDKSAFANGLRDLLKTEIPKAENEGLQKKLNEQIEQFKHIDQLTQTADAKQRELDIQFAKDHATLTANYTGKELADRLALLQKVYGKQLDDAKTVAFQTSQIGVDAATNTFNLTKDQIKRLYQQLKTELAANDAKSDDDPTKLTPAQRSQAKAAELTAKNLALANPKAAELAVHFHDAGDMLATVASLLGGIDDGLSDTIGDISQLANAAGDILSAVATGNPVSIVAASLKGLFTIFSMAKEARESAKKAAAELQKNQDDLLKGEIAYNELIRERARTQQDITKLTLDELKARQDVLKTQNSSAQSDYDKILAKIQSSGEQITGYHDEKYGGVFGAFKKTKVVTDTKGIGNTDYDALEKLYTEGKLTDSTKAWFEELKKVHDEMGDISDEAKAAADQMAQIATGTTASEMASAIMDGFKQGFRTLDDFMDDAAGNFSNVIRKGIDSGFEKNYLQEKINDFYKIYAEAAENGDLQDSAKVEALKAQYAKVIADAGKVYDQQNLVFGAAPTTKASANSLVGNVATITQDQASIIGGSMARQAVLTQQLVDLGKPLPLGQQGQLSELKLHTASLMQIEFNTRQTAINTNRGAEAAEKALEKLDKIGQTDADQLAIAVRGAGFWKY